MNGETVRCAAIDAALGLLGLEASAAKVGSFRIVPKTENAPQVHVFHLSARNEVVLLARLGYVISGRESVYSVLLQHHYLGAKTAGAVFAVDPVTAEVVLQRAVPLAGLSGEQLAGAIVSFEKMATEARHAIG